MTGFGSSRSLRERFALACVLGFAQMIHVDPSLFAPDFASQSPCFPHTNRSKIAQYSSIFLIATGTLDISSRGIASYENGMPIALEMAENWLMPVFRVSFKANTFIRTQNTFQT